MLINLRRASATVSSVATATALLAACGGSDNDTLTIYSTQHASLIRSMLADFTDEFGIEVEFREGGDAELANQIIEEGGSSPADVFLTENSPSINAVDDAGLLAELDASTLDQVGEQYRPSSGTWAGFAARSTALAYDPDTTPESELPVSILDLAQPEWDGRFGIAAGGADFQAIVSGLLSLRGEDATRDWLTGLEQNAEIYQNNIAVMTAVNQGEVEVGVMYHYYWYRDQAESGDNSDNVQLHYFGNQDPGAFLSVSGAGVLASSDQPEQAQRLLAFLTSGEAQQRLAESTALEYAVGNGVASAEVLPALDTLEAPAVDPGSVNAQQVTELMQDVGLL